MYFGLKKQNEFKDLFKMLILYSVIVIVCLKYHYFKMVYLNRLGNCLRYILGRGIIVIPTLFIYFYVKYSLRVFTKYFAVLYV